MFFLLIQTEGIAERERGREIVPHYKYSEKIPSYILSERDTFQRLPAMIPEEKNRPRAPANFIRDPRFTTPRRPCMHRLCSYIFVNSFFSSEVEGPLNFTLDIGTCSFFKLSNFYMYRLHTGLPTMHIYNNINSETLPPHEPKLHQE